MLIGVCCILFKLANGNVLIPHGYLHPGKGRLLAVSEVG